LGVFGLSHFTTQEKLEEIFGAYSNFEKAKLICDKMTGESRGFAFVTFSDEDSAGKALEGTKDMNIDGRAARVDFSVTLKPHDPTPGRYMGPRYMQQCVFSFALPID
jgi:transformer-2 protein